MANKSSETAGKVNNVRTHMSLAQIDAAIENIRKTGKQLRIDAHECLVGVIDHYIEHGDYTRLPILQKAISECIGSSIAQAMVQWVADFVPSLVWNKEERKFVHVPKVEKIVKDIVSDDGLKVGTEVFVGNARDYPFFNLEIKRTEQPFDIVKAFGQLITRAKAAYEKNTSEGAHNAVNHAQIRMLEALDLKSFGRLVELPEDKEQASSANENEGKTEEQKRAGAGASAVH